MRASRTPTCAGCGKVIAPGEAWDLTDGRLFHDDCRRALEVRARARRHAERERREARRALDRTARGRF